MLNGNIKEQLAAGLSSGFVDCNLKPLAKYNPRLVVNNHLKGIKVLSAIESELKDCKEFYFSVAFITEGGLQSLLHSLDRLEKSGIKGKIITSQYQDFTQPKALRRLLTYKNIELKIVTEGNFHAKGYIFKKHDDTYSFLIGSSNLTQSALCENKEWNIRLSSFENGSVMQNIINEFDYTFDNAVEVTPEWIDWYEKIYRSMNQVRQKAREQNDNAVIALHKINPNKMQIQALSNIEMLRKEGKEKALLISATGTGKTFLSAFDVRTFKPKKFLFVVHRENIARAAMKSFKAVLGYDIEAGLLTGHHKDIEKDFIFSTIQTISKEDVLKQFQPNHFDYIVIDEVHRAGAKSYQNIIDHFKPKFLLGMTATPERTDGYDVFKVFDYNIAYEIRLHKALEEKMLSPFHYFGIQDLTVDGEVVDDLTDFNKLVCDERVDKIVETIEHYGYAGDRVKGLIFCSRKAEAKELSSSMNKRGYKTVALCGEDSEEERERAIELLECEKREDGLDYIITVDIFNEGVDIPTVNQIVMLRPTQSAIIFVQQLGRGLRKAQEKSYLTVIDFIGNYSNNYMVPIALYGDRSYNKDNLRKLINNGSSLLPGCSTVSFDEIVKQKIFDAIDSKKNLLGFKELKEKYLLMKYRLGRVPMMCDFLEQGDVDPYAFTAQVKGSYYDFLQRCDSENAKDMNPKQMKHLRFYSQEILNGKRVEEIVLLGMLRETGKVNKEQFCNEILKQFGYEPTEATILSAIRNLNGQFIKDEAAAKYEIEESVTLSGSEICLKESYCKLLNNEDGEFAKFIDDVIQCSLHKFQQIFTPEKYVDGFVLYEKYSRKDVCRILNWDRNEESTVYGYRIKNNTCPIFVTYHKGENISDSTKYEDEFINPSMFSWMTRNNVRLDSKEALALQAYLETGLRISLFVKKSDGEGTDFYYMGDAEPIKFVQTTIKNKEKNLPIVNVRLKLNHEVEDSIYRYFEA